MIQGAAFQSLISALVLLSTALNDHVAPAAHRARMLVVEATAKNMDLGSMELDSKKNDLRRSSFPTLDTLSECRKLPDEMAQASFTSGHLDSSSRFWSLVHDCICKERTRLNQVRTFWSPAPEVYAGSANATSIVRHSIQDALNKWDQVLDRLGAHLGNRVIQQSVGSHFPSHSQQMSYDVGTRFRRDYAVAESTQLLVDAQMRTVTFLMREFREMARS